MSIDTINDLPPRVQYIASASQTVFPYPFPIFQDADLAVEVNGVLQTLTTHYEVSGEEEDTGGNVTFVTGRTAGDIVTIYRQTVLERNSDFQLNGPMFSTSVNDEFDKLIIIAQELRAAIRRCLRIPFSAEVVDADVELSPISAWANKYITLDADGKPQPAELVAGTITQSIIGGLLNPQTAAEDSVDVVPSNTASKEGYLQRYGGVGDGTTISTLALVNAAAQNAATGGVSVKISGGTYRIAANTTIAAGVTLDFTEGGALTIDSGVTFTCNAKIVANPAQQIFAGLGTVVISKDSNPNVWANWFAGADIGAKINAAAASVSKLGPLTIRVAPGTYSYTTPINLIDSESIRLTGSDTCLSTPNARQPNLAYTSNGALTAIDASGAFGFELDHLSLTYTHASYTGNLIDLGIGSTLEARLCRVHDNSIQGNGGTSAARLIRLAGTLSTTIERNYFRYAVRGVGATVQSCNAIAIRDNWFEKDFTAAQIQARGGSWDISCNVFEGRDPAGPITVLELTGELNGLSFRANMCVDGAVGTGTLLDLSGAVCTSAVIESNTLGGGATAVLLRAVAGESRGICIKNNYIISTTGVNMSAGKNIEITGNRFQCTTPWTGTSPQRYVVNNNDLGGTSTSGVSVANSSSIQLAATAAEGSGLIFVYVVEDNAQAIFALNGTANTTTEISDPGGIFSTTAGTGTSINIYSSGGNSYRLENTRGGTRTIIVTSFLAR